MEQEKQWIRVKGKPVGWIEGGAYYTERRAEHFMVKYQSFGISAQVIDELFNRGINWIIFVYNGKTGNKKYIVNRVEFEKGIEFWDGEDKQFHVPLKHMIEQRLT